MLLSLCLIEVQIHLCLICLPHLPSKSQLPEVRALAFPPGSVLSTGREAWPMACLKNAR